MAERAGKSPLMLEVAADDLDAVYATLAEHEAALRAAEEEIAELSSALVAMEGERDWAISRAEQKSDHDGTSEEKQDKGSDSADNFEKLQV